MSQTLTQWAWPDRGQGGGITLVAEINYLKTGDDEMLAWLSTISFKKLEFLLIIHNFGEEKFFIIHKKYLSKAIHNKIRLFRFFQTVPFYFLQILLIKQTNLTSITAADILEITMEL